MEGFKNGTLKINSINPILESFFEEKLIPLSDKIVKEGTRAILEEVTNLKKTYQEDKHNPEITSADFSRLWRSIRILKDDLLKKMDAEVERDSRGVLQSFHSNFLLYNGQLNKLCILDALIEELHCLTDDLINLLSCNLSRVH